MRGGQVLHHRVHVAAQQVGQLGGGGLVRNLAHGGARLRDEQLDADLAGGAGVGRGHGQPVGLGAAGVDEALEIAVRRGCVDDDDVGGFCHQSDRRDIAVQVVQLLLEEVAMQHQRADVGVADGVSIGRGAHQRLRADAAPGADAVFHHHGLAQHARHLLADEARSDVGIAASGGGHDQGDRTFGVIGQRGRGGQAEQQGGKAGNACHGDSRNVDGLRYCAAAAREIRSPCSDGCLEKSNDCLAPAGPPGGPIHSRAPRPPARTAHPARRSAPRHGRARRCRP